MNIGDFAAKYSVTKREIDYWTDLGLIHPKINEKNGYQIYDAENEKEIKYVIIMKAAGMKLDLAHLGFLKMIPDDMYEQIVVEPILEERRRMSRFYDDALSYARE